MSAQEKISFLQPAHDHAELGFAVFPLKPRDKRPMGQLVPRGCLEATTDAIKINDWWGVIPSANIGIATGKPSGFFVLDVDPLHGGNESLKKLSQEVGQFKGTLTAKTGSGGYHFLYRMPQGMDIRNSAGKIAPGLDIRGTGGYIVAPPSIHPNGTSYKWLNTSEINEAPKELIDLILTAATTRQLSKVGPGEVIPHGQQHMTLFQMGCTMRYAGMAEAAIFEALWNTNIERCQEPGPEANIKELASSVSRYEGSGEGLKGFIAKLTTELISREQAIAYVENEERTEEEEKEKVIAGGFTAAELMEMDLPDIKWVVPGVLPEGATLMVGKPKTGKSFFALNLACAVSAGGRALGNIEVNKGRVLYLVLEGSKKGLKKRLEALMAGAPGNSNLHFYPNWPTADMGGVERLDMWLKFHPDTELVIIDTLKMIRGENKTRDVYTRDYDSVNPYTRMAERHGVSALIIHHTNKMQDTEDPFDMASGSTGLMGACDAGMVLKRSNKHEGVDLYVRGRDIEDIEMAMTFDQKLLTWINQGDAAEFGMNSTRGEIMACLQSLDINETISPMEIAERTEQNYDLIKVTLGRMVRDGDAVRQGRGQYKLNPVTSVTLLPLSQNHTQEHSTVTSVLPSVLPSESRNTVQIEHYEAQGNKGNRSNSNYNPTDEAPF